MPAGPSEPGASPLPAGPRRALAGDLVRRRLDNGLDVVLLPRPGLPLVAINLWYHVGSKNERPGRTGLAHLFEHMLFQGSENVSTNGHFRHVQEVGGVANGSTWFDRTNYFETLPAHYLELGLWLESDRMGFFLPGLDEEKLENQRQVVMNERRERVDNQPYGRAFERLHELLYPDGHPYGWPVIGYMDDVAAASLDEVRDFFATHYAPDNAVLTLAGDFEVEAAWDLVNAWFGPIPAAEAARPGVSLPDAPPAGECRETLPDRVALTRIYRGWRVPVFGEADWYAADLLATILTGGRSSPLYEDLVRREELAQDVSAFVLPTELEATFGVVATVRPGADPEAVEAVIDRHLERIHRGEVAEEELRRALNQKASGLCAELESLGSLADRLSMLATYHDDPALIDHQMESYLAVGATELAGLVGRHLGVERRAVVVVVPEEPSS